jgi:putative transcriptional regulator
MLLDPNFYRTVVLICDHNEEGSFGLILNRDTELRPSEFVESVDAVPETVRFGGPVQPDTLHYVHDFGEDIPQAVQLEGHLWWGGDFDVVQSLLGGPDVQHGIRFFIGYAGWGAGQLEGEIEEGSWFVCQAKNAWVFETAPDELWRKAMLSLGGDLALLANYPDNPRMN